MANIDNVQLPDGSSYNIVDNTSGFATQNYVDSAVSSVTKTTIGLGNVDNTSDLNKPISIATQTALDGKVSKSGDTMTGALTISNPGTASALGVSEAVLGNSTSQGVDGNSLGRIDLYGKNQYRARLYDEDLTADRNIALPNKTGTLALTSDVTAITSRNTTDVLDSGTTVKGTIARKHCTNGTVNIMGTTPTGSGTILAKLKTAYKPAQTIGAQVFPASSVDNGKASVYIEQSTGNIILQTTSALTYGAYYNITYTI